MRGKLLYKDFTMEDVHTATQESVNIIGTVSDSFAEILTDEALQFVVRLHRNFNPTRLELLENRQTRQAELDAGNRPNFWQTPKPFAPATGK